MMIIIFFTCKNKKPSPPPAPFPPLPKNSSGEEGGCEPLDLQVMYETSYHQTNLAIGNDFPKVILNSAGFLSSLDTFSRFIIEK